MTPKNTLLIITDLNPSHKTGLGLDIRITTQQGCKSVSVLTGIYADRPSLHYCLDTYQVLQQLESLKDCGINAIRLGLLNSHEIGLLIGQKLQKMFYDVPIVIDGRALIPNGKKFLDSQKVRKFCQFILKTVQLLVIDEKNLPRLCAHLCPNIIGTNNQLESLINYGCETVMLVECHENKASYVLSDKRNIIHMTSDNQLTIPEQETATTIACHIANGLDVMQALRSMSIYTTQKLAKESLT
ncbi:MULTISPECIES: bifunctional hydroxymethylpyrimidine kinase/phosphomethylpyrimidine kinase [Candidatus Ichthyocystis]|uniref:bifunctional hydroxymethylpyrimidine kinase/phosphomethylpyrimidine kinase n=1 Tax=Candidatus Ichthyocystis TaxID=2929841 RepID=UPI000B8954B6|nr:MULTISPECIES: bifunctional hydroxymethylpyrimidine kinase/phosphomethylpyrimidine kinase [Ichthyocystis]